MANDFDKFVSLEPAVAPLAGSEPASQEEQDALDDVMSEVIKFIHGDNNSSIMRIMNNSQELYQGVGQAAFQILLATKQKYERGGQELPSATIFGEGGAIHSAVDEMFQLAQAARIPGSEDQDQYAASIMEVMRLAGEHIESGSDDTSVNEAQELMIDIESTGGPRPVEPADEDSIKGAIQRSMDAQQQPQAPLQPETVPEQAPPQVPQQGGGILNG